MILLLIFLTRYLAVTYSFCPEFYSFFCVVIQINLIILGVQNRLLLEAAFKCSNISNNIMPKTSVIRDELAC